MSPPSTPKAERWMREAILVAQRAEEFGFRPFGAVIVDNNDALVSSSGGTGVDSDPLRHSECVGITEACRLNKGLLEGWSLYSTHEPCHMCAGAILHAHLSVVVWGSYRFDLPELFRDYTVPTLEILRDSSHPPFCVGGVLREECINLLRAELV